MPQPLCINAGEQKMRLLPAYLVGAVPVVLHADNCLTHRQVLALGLL